MSPPPNRPEIKVLVEDANNNHVVVNLRARAIDSVVQHWDSIEEEDKLTVLDKCSMTNTEVVFGLNHYPKLGAASATQTLAKIETSLAKSVEEAGQVAAEEVSCLICEADGDARATTIKPPLYLRDAIVPRRLVLGVPESRADWSARCSALASVQTMTTINMDLLTWRNAVSASIAKYGNKNEISLVEENEKKRKRGKNKAWNEMVDTIEALEEKNKTQKKMIGGYRERLKNLNEIQAPSSSLHAELTDKKAKIKTLTDEKLHYAAELRKEKAKTAAYIAELDRAKKDFSDLKVQLVEEEKSTIRASVELGCIKEMMRDGSLVRAHSSSPRDRSHSPNSE